MKKEAVIILSIAILLFIAACGKEPGCARPNITINGTCCSDIDKDNVCDPTIITLENGSTIRPVCGNSVCDPNENCTTCWKDCGACKKIVYIYVPRNFTLSDLSTNLKAVTREPIKLRKDIENLNNVSDFLFYDKPVTRFFAWFLDTRYRPLYDSRWLVVSKITNPSYYVNNSESLFRLVDYNDWYFTNNIKIAERFTYEDRITRNRALKDYPTQRTGYLKEQMYEEWDFRNYTIDEETIFDNVTILENGMVESLLAVVTKYHIKYKYHEYVDPEGVYLEDYRYVDETRLDYIHTLSLICSPNTVITLYGYNYESDIISAPEITVPALMEQVQTNRIDLLNRARDIKQMCNDLYDDEMLIYDLRSR